MTITRLLMVLGDMLVHGQRTTNRVGRYVGMEITKLPMVLVDMLVHDQCSTNGGNCYASTVVSSLILVYRELRDVNYRNHGTSPVADVAMPTLLVAL